MSLISDNLQAVLDDIRATELRFDRPSKSVRLLAVSKTFGAEAILDAAQHGQTALEKTIFRKR
jgi:uncharacterized pyridoxal phosphate-containing UPF0001 family protein